MNRDVSAIQMREIISSDDPAGHSPSSNAIVDTRFQPPSVSPLALPAPTAYNTYVAGQSHSTALYLRTGSLFTLRNISW
jgi:hypothetical protein